MDSPFKPADRLRLPIILHPAYLPALIAGGWIIIDLILLAVGFIPRNDQEPSQWRIAGILGIVFGQLSYGGFWAAFGPGKVGLRIPLVLGGTALLAAAFFRQVVTYNELEVWFIGFFLGLVLVMQTLLVIFGMLSQRLFGWRIVWQGDAAEPIRAQYGVRDILLWMAGVGVLITVLRFAFGTVIFNTDLIRNLWEDALIGVVLLTATLCQALLAGWAAFSRDEGFRRSFYGLGLSLLLAAMWSIPVAIGWKLVGRAALARAAAD